MSDTLNIAVNGMNASAARIAKAASSIVNASSTGSNGDLATPLTDIAKEKTVFAADAKVVKVVAENHKALLDILA